MTAGSPIAEPVPAASASGAGDSSGRHHRDTWRDTFEQIAIALILAFVFRAFVVEAFVIPTGSMADTLMGRHYEFHCPNCGYGPWYMGVAREENEPANPKSDSRDPVCPNCSYQLSDWRTSEPEINSGDRILVLKYLYEFSRPRRWDVTVFRFPGGDKPGKENYIKRMIGLPGEGVRVVGGDIYISTDGGATWKLSRKPVEAPAVQETLWTLVWTSDFVPKQRDSSQMRLVKGFKGEGDAWSGLDGRVFAFASDDAARHPVRFVQTLNPACEWVSPKPGPRLTEMPIFDFHPYNSGGTMAGKDWGLSLDNPHFNDPRVSVVSDLRVSGDLVWRGGAGEFEMTLTKFDRRFTVRLSADGALTLFELPYTGDIGPIPADAKPAASATAAIPVGRPITVALSNADRVVEFRLDGKILLTYTYNPKPEEIEQAESFEAAQPPRVELAGRQARFEVRHVRIDRDQYYTQSAANGPGGNGTRGGSHNPIQLSDGRQPGTTREYFLLGDNSNASQDSRFWPDPNAVAGGYQAGTVPEENLVGRAFFVFWPSGYPLVGTGLPIVPRVSRLRQIH